LLLLFDYDGVIADSFDSLLEVCVEAQAALGEGRAPGPEDFCSIENLTFDELGRVIGLPADKVASYAGKIFEIQSKGWETRPFPGIVDVILKLAGENTLAVVTSSKADIIAAALDEFGIGGAMTAVTGGEAGVCKAARIAGLQAAHAATGESTFMIGDTVGDIRAGKEAGVRTAAVTWGFQPRELLLKESPDCVLDSPYELLGLAPA